MEHHSQVGQVLRENLGGKARLFLVEIHRQKFEANGRAMLQAQQDIEQRVGILPPRQTHHDAITVRDHAEVADGLANQTAQLRLQLFEIVRMTGCGLHRHHQGASRYLVSRYRK